MDTKKETGTNYIKKRRNKEVIVNVTKKKRGVSAQCLGKPRNLAKLR